MSINSPLSDLACSTPVTQQEGLPSSKDGLNYLGTHTALENRYKMYTERYLKFVVNYAVEWEKVVVTRVMASLKQAEVLRRNLDHYQEKVESMQKSSNVKMAKGKLMDPKETEKLKRNEAKLLKSYNEFDEYARDLCVLLEEVTEGSWKDLHPLFIKIMQFDATLSAEEAKLLGGLNPITESLKQIAQKHGLKPQTRLKDIESMSVRMIAANDAERALEHENRGLIGAGSPMGGGADPLSLGVDAQAQAVLSPLTVASSTGGWAAETPLNSRPLHRATSLSNVASSHGTMGPPTTTDMLSLAAFAAPPPTMDMVKDATGTLSPNSGSASHWQNSRMGALPPLGPSSGARRSISHLTVESSFGGGASVGLESSFGGASAGLESSFGGASAGLESSFGSAYRDSTALPPAPVAPPPPPPSVVGLSMYSSSAVDAAPAQAGYSGYQAKAPSPLDVAVTGTNPWSPQSNRSAVTPSPRVSTSEVPHGQTGSNPFSPSYGTASPNPFDL